MIAYVRGQVTSRAPSRVVVDVHGVGLEIHIPASSFSHIPEKGVAVTLLTHHYVREDTMQLFGFATELERGTFETMLSVSGVGPRLALAALSALDATELRRAIQSEDAATLTRIPGVGRKTADRLVVELRDRLGEFDQDAAETDGVDSGRRDALAALESLGLSRGAAEDRLRKVLAANPGLETAEHLVKLALREQ